MFLFSLDPSWFSNSKPRDRDNPDDHRQQRKSFSAISLQWHLRISPLAPFSEKGSPFPFSTRSCVLSSAFPRVLSSASSPFDRHPPPCAWRHLDGASPLPSSPFTVSLFAFSHLSMRHFASSPLPSYSRRRPLNPPLAPPVTCLAWWASDTCRSRARSIAAVTCTLR